VVAVKAPMNDVPLTTRAVAQTATTASRTRLDAPNLDHAMFAPFSLRPPTQVPPQRCAEAHRRVRGSIGTGQMARVPIAVGSLRARAAR